MDEQDPLDGPGAPRDVRGVVRRTVLDDLLDEPFHGDDPLAELELDSLLLEQLVDRVEEHYRVLFEPEDLERHHFESLDALAAVVEARWRATHGPAA